jgi:CRISPR-associated protein (TIGR03984 family)
MNQNLCEVSTETLTEETLKNWLQAQAITDNYHLRYLLAHAEDGVIWGYFPSDGNLEIARDVFPSSNFPELRLKTLQQCRIFGKDAEILLWNSNGEWKSRKITQRTVLELLEQKEIGLIPEEQILWGTEGKEKGNFTLLSDGSEGLKYAVPIINITFENGNEKPKRPVQLIVNHYFCYDKDGIARIFLSRLVSLSLK